MPPKSPNHTKPNGIQIQTAPRTTGSMTSDMASSPPCVGGLQLLIHLPGFHVYPPQFIDYLIRLRCTKGPRCYQARTKFPETHACLIQIIAYTDIGTTPGTHRDAASAMGKELNDGRKLPAWAHSGRGKPQDDRERRDEWNHLLADCLGGALVPKNLVAASPPANTFMLVIESRIRGNSNVQVEVEAHCSYPHVAEWIVYKLRSKKDPRRKIQFKIDAACQHFTVADAIRVENQVDNWLRASGIYKTPSKNR